MTVCYFLNCSVSDAKEESKIFAVTATHGQYIIERVVYGSRNCQLTIVTVWLIYPLWSFQSTYGLV